MPLTPPPGDNQSNERMGNMTDLVARLREAIDETEQVAKSASGWGASGRTWRRDLISCVEDGDGRLIVYGEGTPTSAEADHIARHDPAAVLRRCAADRKIVDLHAPREYRIAGRPSVLQCEHCASLCHSGSGLACDSPDAPYPCETVQIVAEAYGVEA